MNASSWLAGLLALAATLGIVRLLWWRHRAVERARAWRLAVLLLAQPLCALLLYLALMPPTSPGRAGTMTVLTAGAQAPLRTDPAAGDVMIALPEAPATMAAERVPDLATALRRHPGMRQLHVIGAGLEPRDRDATRGLGLDFTAAPLPRGLVRLDSPGQVVAGASFVVAGQVHGIDGANVELRDPAGRRLDVVSAAEDGVFRLTGTTRAPGLVDFRLRVSDRRHGRVEEIDVPLQVVSEPPPRVLVLAGAPNAEWKYLRRWMADAGMQPHVQIQVGVGLQLGDAPLPLNAATFARFDLLVLDDRAWASLGGTAQAALAAALRDGLGVLLRVEGPLPDTTRRQLRELGLMVSGGGESTEVRLATGGEDEEGLRARRGAGSRDAPIDMEATGIPVLARRQLRGASVDAVPLLRDAAGGVIADWRAEGRGRIGVWPLTDTYRLTLAGRADRHAELWSEVFATLARARRGAGPAIQREARVGAGMRLCGIAAGARVIAPDGTAARLLTDPASGGASCAGYWPAQRGWHRLRQGDQDWPFPVRAADETPGLRVMDRWNGTRERVGPPVSPAGGAGAAPARPGSPWPWWLAWLCCSVALWWFERSRLGRTRHAAASVG
nr:carboxypeptidase regulatory-like domain-containing protein [Pseudoxanthomonas sp.]